MDLDALKQNEFIEDLHKSMSEIYSFNKLSNEEKEKLIEKLKVEYNDYVVKPNKEGGNNNYNYERVKELADTKNLDVLNGSLIMKRIYPPTSKNIVLKGMKLYSEDVITEVGIFCWILTDYKENSSYIQEIRNVVSSPFFRTKQEKEPEGGMSIGASYANTGYKVDNYIK